MNVETVLPATMPEEAWRKSPKYLEICMDRFKYFAYVSLCRDVLLAKENVLLATLPAEV